MAGHLIDAQQVSSRPHRFLARTPKRWEPAVAPAAVDRAPVWAASVAGPALAKPRGAPVPDQDLGEGSPVVLCHGFPEIWYSWRHQLRALAAAGFRAIAPDQRVSRDHRMHSVTMLPRHLPNKPTFRTLIRVSTF